MPGMSSGLSPNNSTIVSAFQSALLHQALVVVVILVLLAIAWNVLRSVQYRNAAAAVAVERAGAADAGDGDSAAGRTPIVSMYPLATKLEVWAETEPSGRRVLRIGFGLLWVFDGVLQAQASMPLGMTTQAIAPTAKASPAWAQHVVNLGATVWSDHPIVAAAAVVWIQLGIGLWLLVAPRGFWSRGAGLVSMGWGLVVWVFGEVFGGVLVPGVTWMFGAPGAVLFYCFAGALIALDDRRWANSQLGRVILRTMGVFFLAMAVLQSWPGRGFWQGRVPNAGGAGMLTAMVTQMAGTPQPRLLASWVRAFASTDAAHGWAVNLFVVIALALIGLGWLSRRDRIVLTTVVVAAVLCLADWVLVEDFGFFGGTGTDPNSMIPMLLVFVAGYVAMIRTVVTTEAEVLDPQLELPADLTPEPGGVRKLEEAELHRPPWRERVRTHPAYAFRVLSAMGAVILMLLGAAPMALASLNHRADPIVSQAVDGPPTAVDLVAPSFQLENQYGRPVSLASLHGKVLTMTFLDPVCTKECIIAQEFHQAAALMAADTGKVDFVAVVANPVYRSLSVVQAFDRTEGLVGMSNWLFLTGLATELAKVWKSYSVAVHVEPAGAMVSHSEIAFVIDASGYERFRLNTQPGPATAATEASFASVLAESLQQVLRSK